MKMFKKILENGHRVSVKDIRNIIMSGMREDDNPDNKDTQLTGEKDAAINAALASAPDELNVARLQDGDTYEISVKNVGSMSTNQVQTMINNLTTSLKLAGVSKIVVKNITGINPVTSPTIISPQSGISESGKRFVEQPDSPNGPSGDFDRTDLSGQDDNIQTAIKSLPNHFKITKGDAEGEWNIASTVDMTAADSTGTAAFNNAADVLKAAGALIVNIISGPAIIPPDSGQSMVTKTESLLHSSWR
jgi:hypothetical protein